MMNKEEASEILCTEIKRYRDYAYKDLIKLIDSEPITFERNGARGTSYQIEIQAFGDDKPDGDVRVIGSIADGGLRAFFPLCQAFIMTSDGAFVMSSYWVDHAPSL